MFLSSHQTQTSVGGKSFVGTFAKLSTGRRWAVTVAALLPSLPLCCPQDGYEMSSMRGARFGRASWHTRCSASHTACRRISLKFCILPIALPPREGRGGGGIGKNERKERARRRLRLRRQSQPLPLHSLSGVLKRSRGGEEEAYFDYSHSRTLLCDVYFIALGHCRLQPHTFE